MPSLIIRDLPVELHLALKARAAEHHRSMSKEVRFLLEAQLSRQPMPRWDLVPAEPMALLKKSNLDPVKIIRAARDAR